MILKEQLEKIKSLYPNLYFDYYGLAKLDNSPKIGELIEPYIYFYNPKNEKEKLYGIICLDIINNTVPWLLENIDKYEGEIIIIASNFMEKSNNKGEFILNDSIRIC